MTYFKFNFLIYQISPTLSKKDMNKTWKYFMAIYRYIPKLHVSMKFPHNISKYILTFISLLLILRVSVKGNGGWKESHFAIVSDWDCHILRIIASAFQEEMLQLRNEGAASLLFFVETWWYMKGACTYDVLGYLIVGVP